MRRSIPLTIAAAVLTVGMLTGCSAAPPAPPAVPEVTVEGNDPRVQPNDPQAPVPPSAFAASSSGSWTGYWNWTWVDGKWVAKWVWVWTASSGGYTTG